MVRLRRRGAGAHERAPPRYVLPPPEIADTRRLLAASRQSRAAAPKKSPSAAHEHHEPTRALREPTDAPGASKGCAPLSTSWKPDAARHALSSRYLEVRATDGKFASRLAAVALGSLLDHPLARIPEGHGQPPPGRHPEPVSSRGVTLMMVGVEKGVGSSRGGGSGGRGWTTVHPVEIPKPSPGSSQPALVRLVRA